LAVKSPRCLEAGEARGKSIAAWSILDTIWQIECGAPFSPFQGFQHRTVMANQQAI
jgi:hypothetical protein